MNRMDEKESVHHLVLAHELSHLYKRHTIKEMQYRLVTSDAGFGLAKKLLSRYNPDAASGPVAMAQDALLYVNAAKELLDWVSEHQVQFGIDQELEADACSVVWMNRSNLDPKTLLPALAELEAVKTESDGSYARTHPTSKQRQDNLLVATGQKVAPAPTAVRPAAKPARTSKSPS
jgi:predicted Zn-dependent protease